MARRAAGSGPTGHRSWRLRTRHTLILILVSTGLLWLTIAVVPGVDVNSAAAALVATISIVVASALIRALLSEIATWIGWLGVVLGGLVAQAVIFYVALSVVPDVSLSGFWPAFWASWIYAVLTGIAGWLLDAGDDDLFAIDVLRGAGPAAGKPPTGEPGVVMIQIDGLSAPLLRWALLAGDLPTLGRWIRDDSHRLVDWRAQLPATTPASQAGILHGRSDAVPAFRWYDKAAGKLTVTNHPRDAAVIEERLSNGRGLLADGGVSIGNIFSGDAPTAVLTMSREPSRGGPSRQFAAAYMRPFGMARAIVLSIGEMLAEVNQGHRQRARNLQPRIDRRSSYVVLRALTNVVLRDVNVRLLAEQMMAGTPVMYCDFTDYDEVAHHAGPMRAESLASLRGVDRVLAVLERIAAAAPRRYEFVVLSDHGQSQGATFRQSRGRSLATVVDELADECRSDDAAPSTATAVGAPADEAWGRAGTLLRTVGRGHGPLARLNRRLAGHAVQRRSAEEGSAAARDIVVAASGNLALVYFSCVSGRASREDLEKVYPGLVARLAGEAGIGFVAVQSAARGLTVVGAHGTNYLDDNQIEGLDPLAPFGPAAPAEVRRHASLPCVGDLVVNSDVDEMSGEVAAFEELVGCHGGLGGWQSEAVLLHPAHWDPPRRLIGADAVHTQLIEWLAMLGLRRQDQPSPVDVQPVTAGRSIGHRSIGHRSIGLSADGSP